MTEPENIKPRSDVDNWGAEEWRQPTPRPDDTVLYSEHGRSLNRIDYRSHSFKLVAEKWGGYCLLVKHGGGEERVSLGYESTTGYKAIFAALDSDSRYLLLHNLLSLYHDTRRTAESRTAADYRQAFVNDRLRKRKTRGGDSVKVWIEPSKSATQERDWTAGKA